jgi:hypothetical protein
MSTASLHKVSSTGTFLKDCLHSQHYYISLNIDDPEGKILCRVAMSYDQFVKLLVDSSEVTVTLERYRDEQGKMVVEEVKPPESVQDRLIDRLGEVHSDLGKRITDLKKDIYEHLNSGKVGKKDLEKLLLDAEVIESHYASNFSYTVERASEEVNELKENAKAQLSIFLSSKGLDVKPDELTPMLESKSVKQLPSPQEPIRENYEPKQRQQKTIEDMTALEVADEMHKHLKRLERTSTGNAVLFNSSANSTRVNVNVRYINYQGSTKLTLEEAKDYLKYLRTVKDASLFKTHYWYKSKKKN